MNYNIQISKNFALWEFLTTTHKDLYQINREMLTSDYLCNVIQMIHSLLQPIRTILNTPMIITSGFRCQSLNSKISKYPNSRHTMGLAIDFKPKRVSIDLYYNKLVQTLEMYNFPFHKCILENVNGKKWIHLSFYKFLIGESPLKRTLKIGE